MKYKFLKKYQDYCEDKNEGGIVGVTQNEDESIEDYIEQFKYDLQRVR